MTSVSADSASGASGASGWTGASDAPGAPGGTGASDAPAPPDAPGQTAISAGLDLAVPSSAASVAVEQVARRYCSPALLNHSVRSYLWAAVVGRQDGIAFDAELLYVAALLHDLGLTTPFDSHTLPFEEAGGHVARVFAAGAGWPAERGDRAAEVIERHMWAEVDPAMDAEGHLLEVGTGIDISGSRTGDIPLSVRDDVLRRWPRLGLGPEFTVCIRDQAQRKPGSRAAAIAARVVAGLRQHPYELDV